MEAHCFAPCRGAWQCNASAFAEWRAEVDGPMPQTPLIWAAARGRKDCAQILIRGRADVRRRDQAGLDALSWVAKLPQVQCDALQKDLNLLLTESED